MAMNFNSLDRRLPDSRISLITDRLINLALPSRTGLKIMLYDACLLTIHNNKTREPLSFFGQCLAEILLFDQMVMTVP